MRNTAAVAVLASLCAPLMPTPLRAACVITGPYTIDCDGVTYRAVDDECVHFVDLAAHNAAHSGVPLPDLKKTLLDNYEATATIQPVVVRLSDYVDCAGTDHNFSDANIVPSQTLPAPGGGTFNTNPHPNKPSRLMSIGGKLFRVTAAPDDGFATYYYSYDVSLGGTAGTPHLLVAESSNDQERYTSLIIHHPDPVLMDPSSYMPAWAAWGWAPPYLGEPDISPWGGEEWWDVNYEHTQQGPVFAPDVGLTTYTGRELPIDNLPFNISMIFHAKSRLTRIVVTSLGCNLTRTGSDGGAVSRMWVFAFVDAMADRYPAMRLPSNPAEQRHLGIYLTHPWYLYAHHGTPVRTLGQRVTDLQRFVQHVKHCGLDYVAFNVVNGADRSEKAWYEGSNYFPWNQAGDLLAELTPIAEAEGVQVVPIITSLQATSTNGLSLPTATYQMGSNGSYTYAFGSPTLDPLHPDVPQLTFNLLREIANRVSWSSAIRGIGIRVNGKIGTCYTADSGGTRGAKLSGYSSWDLQQFKNDTGSGVPTSPPSTAYNWLSARPTEWEKWINWRCQRTRAFWLACRDLIRSHHADWVFYVQCDLPSEVPGTNIEWPGQTPYNLLRHHGYDPNMFVNDAGIIISRGMMVATDRFYVGTRWGSPWGSNHDRYRTFHYAAGLPELYRTAAGRACEFYQNYWEEAYNPYLEYGWPTDAGGYFRTTTPAAFGRSFFAGATMSVRRQDPDTMVWLGWNRPTLGHENELRKFAQAFRTLPAVTPVAFDGTVIPALAEVVARWHRNRLAVINDTNTGRTITLSFAQPVPSGKELVDAVTGRKLVSASQGERRNVSFNAEAYSLNTFLYNGPAPGAASPPTARDVSVATPADTPVTIALTAEDDGAPDPPGALTYIVTSLPAHGNLSDPDAGAITAVPYVLAGMNGVVAYTPSAAYVGTDTFMFKASDGGIAPAGGDSSEAAASVSVSECLFSDGFPSFTLNAANWTITASEPTVDSVGTGEPSPPMSLRLNGDPAGSEQVDSRVIDLAGRHDMELRYAYERGGGGSLPGAGHDLIVKYLTAGGAWVELARHPGEGAHMGRYDTNAIRLSPDAHHAGFRIRFCNAAGVGPCDDWFVDDVCIREVPPRSRDFDGDGDVDLQDFSFFQMCFGGPNRPPTQPLCDLADFDADNDVDLTDFATFQACFNGPNRPPAC